MAAGRHLGFFKTEIITIRSAIPENPTLEPNITLIRQAVAKLWLFLFIQDGCQPPYWILKIPRGGSLYTQWILELHDKDY